MTVRLSRLNALGSAVFLLFVAAASSPPPLFAEQLVTGAQVCAAVTPSQSESMEWRENGLFNRHPDRALFVICPYTRSRADNSFTGTIHLKNESSTSTEIECVFREIAVDGSKNRTTVRTANLAPGESAGLTLDSVPMRDPDGFYSVTCHLPPDNAIVTLLTTVGDATPDDDTDPPDTGGGSQDANRLNTERLRGVWEFTYRIISTFSDRYRLDSEVRESTESPGDWRIFGTDEFGNPVIAGYSSDLELWVLLDQGSIIDKFFAFEFTDPLFTRVAGCYFQIDPPGSSNLSDCFAMSGLKIGSAKATASSVSPLEQEAQQRHEAEIYRYMMKDETGSTVSGPYGRDRIEAALNQALADLQKR